MPNTSRMLMSRDQQICSGKGQTASILGFLGHMDSLTKTQLFVMA